MIDSGIELAVNFACRGARVIFVCEHHVEVPDMLDSAIDLAGENLVKVCKINGAQHIKTERGGVIYFFSPGSSGPRGIIADVVFAPPLVWDDEKLAVALVVCTNGSTFFDNHGPVMFSTLQRIGG